MTNEKIAAYGIFDTRAQAESCVTALTVAGFRSQDVSVLMSNQDTVQQIGTEKNTKAPEGAVTGATTAGVIGGTLGLLAGIGVLSVAGMGPLIAAGPIMATLAGLGTGATAGGIIGALMGAGMPEYEAKRYEGHIKKGNLLLSVHCDNVEWAKKAKEILKNSGAEDVSSGDEAEVRKAS